MTLFGKNYSHDKKKKKKHTLWKGLSTLQFLYSVDEENECEIDLSKVIQLVNGRVTPYFSFLYAWFMAALSLHHCASSRHLRAVHQFSVVH